MSDFSVLQPTLTLAGARRLITAASEHAASLGVAVVITVVGRTGELIALERQDGAFAFSVDAAQQKAWTAAVSGVATLDFGKLFLSEPALIHGLAPKIDRLMVVGGGVPVLVDGVVAGAVGVSGATEEQDHQIALHAATRD